MKWLHVTGLFLFFVLAVVVSGTLINMSDGVTASVGKEPQVITYHKTIEVKVVDSRITWESAKSHYCTGFIEVKSEKYGLNEVVNIATGSPHFYEVYSGSLEQGDTIKAVLYSVKKGDKIIKRYLGELER